jgi:hypothetical protein
MHLLDLDASRKLVSRECLHVLLVELPAVGLGGAFLQLLLYGWFNSKDSDHGSSGDCVSGLPILSVKVA